MPDQSGSSTCIRHVGLQPHFNDRANTQTCPESKFPDGWKGSVASFLGRNEQ
jgi:hypothetical protein